MKTNNPLRTEVCVDCLRTVWQRCFLLTVFALCVAPASFAQDLQIAGEITFWSKRDGNHEIYKMASDGTAVVRLTSTSASESYPHWSPDGTQITFATDRDGNSEIYAMSADGSNSVNLTNNSSLDAGHYWSPDGSQIVFYSDRDGNREIYVMNADGSGLTRLTNNSVLDDLPSWSPDGTQIAFRSNRDGNYEIYVMNADGSNPVRLTNHIAQDEYAAWSPDGTRILFQSNRDGNREIYAMEADGTGLTRITNTATDEDIASWSADGTRILLGRNSSSVPAEYYTSYEIYVIDVDGTNEQQLTSNLSSDYAPTQILFQQIGTTALGSATSRTLTIENAGTLALVVSDITSSDGQFVINPTNFSVAAGGSQEVMVTFAPTSVGVQYSTLSITSNDPDSPAISLIVNGSNFQLPSLDYTKIAFTSDRDGDNDIYLMDADGSSVVQITDDPSDDRGATWSPDGQRIGFDSDRDGDYEIYSMDRDGSNLVQLTDNTATDFWKHWSPDGSKIVFISDRDGNSEVYVMNVDGSGQTNLTNNPALDTSPSWSPDGSKVLFSSDRDGNSEIYVMNVDGSNVTRLTNDLAYDYLPHWSPDGSRIAFSSDRDSAPNSGWQHTKIFTMDPDGNNVVQITTFAAALIYWSPDGSRFSLTTGQDGYSEIYTMAADGTDLRRLTNDPAMDWVPIWSPFFAFSAAIPDTSAAYASSTRIPVRLTDTSGRSIVAAEVFVAFDGDLLTATGVDLTGALAASGWSIANNIAVGNSTPIDTLKIAMATDNDALVGAGDLLYIDFDVVDVRQPTSSVLQLTHVLFNDGTPEVTLFDGSLTVTGHDANGSTDVAAVIPRESIVVTVVDADADLDGNPATDQIIVTVVNGLQGETLVLNETATAGEFAGSISTVFALASTAAVSSSDGVVQAKAGDQIAFTFVDQLLGDGHGPADLSFFVDVIGGSDGSVEITRATQPGDGVYIKVIDADLNTSLSTAESAIVVVTSTNGETEMVVLTEVDADDEVFFGQLSSAPGAVAGADDDGSINSAKGDQLTATYDDVVTALGDQLDRADVDQVVDPFGDADGNGSVQAFDAAKVLLHVLSPSLTGIELIQANIDLDPEGTGVTPFDASLILQKRVGLIGIFPVQTAASTNHPQPTATSSKWVVESRLFSLVSSDGYLSLVADKRDGLLAGDLLIEGVEGRVALSEEMSDFLVQARQTEEGLHIVFAGTQAVSGAGELLRFYGVGPEGARLVRAVFNDGRITGNGVGSSALLPTALTLHPNTPNPFNPETTIAFDLPMANDVRLEIFDALGQNVKTLVASTLSAGLHRVVWDGRDERGITAGSGLYFYRLRVGAEVKVRRMVLVK